MRTRGFVRTADVTPVPGAPEQFAVDVRLTDASNVEQYVRWRGPHFIGSEPATAVTIEHGDEIEVLLEAGARGGYTRGSYVHNHTQGVTYTFLKAKTGCLAVLVAAALLAGAAAVLMLGTAP